MEKFARKMFGLQEDILKMNKAIGILRSVKDGRKFVDIYKRFGGDLYMLISL